jgi:lambda family phage portal protein
MAASGLVDMYGRPWQSTQAPVSPRRTSRLVNSGYSNAGASREKPIFKAWPWSGGSPDDDIVEHLPILRQRSRQLSVESPIVDGVYDTRDTFAVGAGVKPEPIPDGDFLGLTDQQVITLKKQILRLWEAFAEDTQCDFYGRSNFYELTSLVCRSEAESGDSFVMLPYIDDENSDFSLKIRVVEADCVTEPKGREVIWSKKQGFDDKGGVRQDRQGRIQGYWFYTGHPLAKQPLEQQDPYNQKKWVYIPLFGEHSRRKNVLHIMNITRPGQRRGIPLIAPSLELLLILDGYMDAEAIASLIQAKFTVIVTSEEPDSAMGEMAELEGDQEDDSIISLGNGIIQYAKPGQGIQTVNPSRPTNVFDKFVQAILQMCGPSLGLPYEMLMQKFDASYSASRAAMNIARANILKIRARLVNSFCQPAYAAFMDECVANGWIHAPGYWDSPLVRNAYTRAKWNGPAMPQIDPTKEVQAALLRVAGGFSTRGEETRELTGNDVYETLEEQAREYDFAGNLGLVLATSPQGISQVNQNVTPEADTTEEGGAPVGET